MPDLLIRDVDDRVIADLQQLAAARGTTLEALLHDHLTKRALEDFQTTLDE